MIDPATICRENMRWLILLALHHAGPADLAESLVLATAQAVHPDATPLEVRRELDYLSDRKLVDIRKDPAGPWWSNLTRHGAAIVAYTIPCEQGIARPAKYW